MSIVVEDLRRSYGSVQAVRGVSFEVPTGSLFAFLGTNGAGKSTTIGCITTVLRADSGVVAVNGLVVGRDDDAIRREIGVVFQSSLLDPLLTVRENLKLRAGFYGIRGAELEGRVDEVVTAIGLEGFTDRRYGRLSGGQKRRADIARALVHNPSVVFLDEPTAGLDPHSREQVWGVIGDLRRSHDTTIFLTTHYMEETESADAVCIIDEGRIVAQGTPAGLREQHSSSVLSLRFRDLAQGQTILTGWGVAFRSDRETTLVTVASSDEARMLLSRLGDDVVDFEFRHGTMDDVFLALTVRSPEQ